MEDRNGEVTGTPRKLIDGTAVKQQELQYTLDDLFARLEEQRTN